MALTLRTQARDEAYASVRIDTQPIPVVTLDNPAFDAPLHFIQGHDEAEEAEVDGKFVVSIVLETGQRVNAIPCAFKCTLPGFDDGGPTPARLVVDNVGARIYPYLKEASGPISVTYRGYLSDDLTRVADLIEGLVMKVVNLSSTSAEGELVYEEIATQNFPRRTYDLDTYPSLWNS